MLNRCKTIGLAVVKAGVRYVNKKLTSRGATALCVQAAAGFVIGMVIAADEAHAGFATFAQNLWTSFDPSGGGSGGTFAAIGTTLGGAGTLASGYSLWNGLHDGGGLGDNLKPISALLPSTALLGYSTYVGYLKQ